MYSAYCNTTPHLLYYNCPKGEELTAKRQDEKISKRFEKGLDNPLLMWYNIIKGKENPPNQKGIDTMATTKKMTKREMFEQIKTHLTDPAEVAFVEHELELLAKKNSGEKKPTAQQVANDGIKTAIAEGMTANRLYTVTELIKEIPECAELTNQRVSALLRQMIADGTVVKTVDKRKSYFQIVE